MVSPRLCHEWVEGCDQDVTMHTKASSVHGGRERPQWALPHCQLGGGGHTDYLEVEG